MHQHAKRFRDKGFLPLEGMEQIMPSQSKGMHIFCPGGTSSTPVPPSTVTPPSPVNQTPMATTSRAVASACAIQPPLNQTPVATTSQVVDSTHAIQPSTTQAPCDISAAPSTPSSFLAPSDHGSNSSSVLTSVSRGKRKAGTMSGAGSTVDSAASDTSQKQIRGPSATATVQMEGVEVMKQISQTVEGMSKAFALLGITITTNDIFQQAIAVLTTHEGDVSVDNYLDLAEYLTMPANKQQATIFAGLGHVAHKRWLEKCLAEMAKKPT